MNQEEWSHLKETETTVRAKISGAAHLHAVHFVPISKNEIEIYIFYKSVADACRNADDGIDQFIKSLFIDKLNDVGRGPRQNVMLRFIFDSHENVVKNFQGSYFLRLR